MRMGVMIGGSTADELIAKARDLEERGFDSVWLANPPGYGFDTLVAMALIAQETERIELGTAVVPIYMHHPAALAQAALSIQKVAGGRFTLGIGLSHPVVVEGWLGLPYKRGLSRLAEYLTVLEPLLNGEKVKYAGEFYRADIGIYLSDVAPVPVLLAALGSNMLELAGSRTKGTVTYLTGPRTLESHIIPRLNTAAAKAGLSAPRVVAGGLPMAVVADEVAARAAIAAGWAGYGDLPTYRGVLDREGAAGPADVAILGDRATVQAALDHLAAIGVTDLMASLFAPDENTYRRTLDFLTEQL